MSEPVRGEGRDREPRFGFTLEARDGDARAGLLATPHGVVRTPTFMCVATYGAVRGVGPDVNGFKVGGDFLFLNSLEYQVPIKAGDNLFLVGFVDSGTVESSVEFKDYRVSAGVGVRFVVPLLGPVPIALDFGFPIVKADADRDQVFSFWLGFFR